MPSTPTDQPKPSARRTSAHYPAVNSIGKGKTKAHEESPINSLPPELLAHCFALLPAGSLLAATLVCKAWYHVATDETSWRSAFANYYGLPESGQLPGRRVDASSWKAEYLTRTRLIRRWIKSRNASLTYDAHAGGRISDLVVSLTDAMTVSIQGAAASRSDPTTSRILRTHIHPGGAPGQVTAARANERGQAIAWGCRDGDIRISLVCAPVSRPLSLSNLGTDATKHRGPVTALAFAPFPHASPPNRTTFASTAVDGIVKVWDTECTPPSACLFSSNPFERMRRDEGGDVDVGLALAYAPSQRTVAVGTEGGVLHAWRLDGQWQSRGYTRWTDGESETKPPIVQILLDTAAMTTTDSYSCLFRRMGASTFERLWLFGQAKKTRSYGIDSGAALTAVTVDFASPRNVVGFGAHKYVVTADEEAVVALYLWDDESTAKLTAPCKLLQKRSSAAAPVTALALSDLLVFVGSIDGTVKAYDPLTGQLIRAIVDRSAPRQAVRALAAGLGTEEEKERFGIALLRATRAGVVATAGTRVIAWRVDEGKGKGKKRKLRPSNGVKSAASRTERFSNDREMQQDVHEVREALGAERQARIERAEERAAGGHTLAAPALDMTEDEQLAYAMLVSQEQADADAIAAAYEEDVALLNLNDDEDATAIFTPPRPRPSRMSSRTSSASTSSLANEAIEEDEEEDDHDSFVGGTSPASIYSNRYYPISPRLMPTAPPDINDDSAFPSPSPRARSPLLSPILGPTTPSKRYSEAAARATPSPTSLSFDISPAPSRRSRQSRPAAEEGDDADLQFAIELSLAEARSRLDGE